MMPKKFFIPSLFILLSSMGAHLYLSIRSYSIKSDQAKQSPLCQISEKWNCDFALASDFSEIFNIPISHFGFAFNLTCLLILILLKWGWLNPVRSWSNGLWKTALFLALGTIVMFFISFFELKKFCSFCVFIYILSFLVLWPLKKGLPFCEIKIPSFQKKDLQPLFYILSSTGFIVFMLYVFSLQSYPIQKMESTAQAHFRDWKQADPVHLPKSLLKSGPSKSVFTVVEVIDFLCSYCKHADHILKNFQNIYSDVRIEWIGYPLDSRGCSNQTVQASPNCYLVKSVLCAKNQNLGLRLKDFIFDHQQEFILFSSTLSEKLSIKNMKAKIKNQMLLWGADFKVFENCINSHETINTISNHIHWGQEINIRGTPSLFVEGKKIEPSAIRLTLEKIYKDLKKL